MQSSGMCNEYMRYVMAGVAATLILLLFSNQLAFAAGQSTHPANENEFVGYWRILLIDNDRHKSGIKNEETNYTDPCQFLIHQSDGSWMNISPMIVGGQKATKDNCPADRAEIDKHIAIAKPLSQPFKWSKLKNKNGLFYVADPVTNSGLLWKVDFVAEDLPVVERIGFALRRGDMIMQLARRLESNEIAPVWPMVLRPVQSSALVPTGACMFVDNKNGTVTNTRDGMIWKHCDEGLDFRNDACVGTPIVTNWNKAQLMARQSWFLGKNDWRLPTKEDFKSMAKSYADCSDSKFFARIVNGYGTFWTASPYVGVIADLFNSRVSYDFVGDPIYLSSGLPIRVVRMGR